MNLRRIRTLSIRNLVRQSLIMLFLVTTIIIKINGTKTRILTSLLAQDILECSQDLQRIKSVKWINKIILIQSWSLKKVRADMKKMKVMISYYIWRIIMISALSRSPIIDQ